MKIWFVQIALVASLTLTVPTVDATCAPREIDYVVGQEYKFECPEGTFHGIHAVDLSQQEPALRVCFDGFCFENCGPIIFAGVGPGTVTIEVLQVHVDPPSLPRVCTGTVGTIYING